MAVFIEKFDIFTKGFDDVIDITSRVASIVANSRTQNGLVNVLIPTSCASIFVVENEPNLPFDIVKMLEMIAPVNKVYQHDNNWHDGNAYAHLKASLIGNSINLSVIDGQIQIANTQKIILIDFDNKSRTRQIVVSIVE